jgi:diguanylate cyclase (GGDEF)-like protein
MNSASTPAAVRTAAGVEIFTKVIGGYKKLVKSARHQVEMLVERNSELQKELTALVQKEALVRHLAYHDELTGLPNRGLLQDRFRHALLQAEQHHKPLALLMLDLEAFKRVNEKLGRASGDKLLQAVARRLTKGIRGTDTACRYGGDEFVIMMPEIYNPGSATAIAVDIGRRLSEPFIIDGHNIRMAVNIGVAVSPGDGRTLDALMKQADIALYRTKRTGHSTPITEQAKDDAGIAELYNPPVPKKSIDRTHKRDLSIRGEPVQAPEKQNNHQQI